jgi:hypothetical protein
MVLPGQYTARLTVGEQQMEQSFEVLADPRVEAEGLTLDKLQAQGEWQQKVISLLSEARQFQDRLEKDLKKAKGSSERQEKLKNVLNKLRNAKGAYPQQMLVSQISYLYNMVGRTDQKVGKDVQERYEELKTVLEELNSSLD